MDDEHFMRMAIDLATENARTGRGGPFGAVIVRDGQVLATGVNQVTANHDPTAHAEVTAIRNACRALGSFQLQGATIYSSCEPCPMCLSAIYWAHCSALVYGNTAADAAAIGFDDAHIYSEVRKLTGERQLPTKGLCREQALESFNAWRDAEARQMY